MQTGANAVFGKLSSDDVSAWGLPSELLKQRARNSDIQQFFVERSGEFLLYHEDVDRYESLPESVQRYLEEPAHRAKLEGRAAYRRGNCEWWRYTWPLHRERYRGPRLISPYLLALLNSRLMTFRFRGLAKLTGRNMWGPSTTRSLRCQSGGSTSITPWTEKDTTSWSNSYAAPRTP
jgi:hypothetical protein